MDWKRRLYYILGPRTRRIARRLYYLPVDTLESLSGKRDALTPPKGKIFIGPGNFRELGEKLRANFIEFGALKPSDRVLDVGCGIGRIAIPLTQYLNRQGAYEGFDIVEDGIKWCSKKITPKFPNFHFRHIALKNDLYNLQTSQSASEFIFPYPDKSFDFVILTSVFTHMQIEEVKHYLHEISRTMDHGATCFATFFIIDQASQDFLNRSEKPFFAYDGGDFMLHDKQVKDANIAFRLEAVERMCADAGLRIHKFHPGWWAGRNRQACVDFQDVLILKHV